MASLLPDLEALEAHECHSEKRRCDEGDRETFKGLWTIGKDESLSYTCKKHDSKCEADTCRETIDNAADKVELVCDVEKSRTEDCAVCCDEWEEDTESLIKSRHHLHKKHFNKLNERCDNKDKCNCLHITDVKRNENKSVHNVSYSGRNCHNEYNSHTHTESCIHLLGYAEEGADTQEAGQHVVIDQHRGEQNDDEGLEHFHYCAPPSFFSTGLRKPP